MFNYFFRRAPKKVTATTSQWRQSNAESPSPSISNNNSPQFRNFNSNSDSDSATVILSSAAVAAAATMLVTPTSFEKPTTSVTEVVPPPNTTHAKLNLNNSGDDGNIVPVVVTHEPPPPISSSSSRRHEEQSVCAISVNDHDDDDKTTATSTTMSTNDPPQSCSIGAESKPPPVDTATSTSKVPEMPVAPQRRSSNVKPCGHGTLAVPPRIPVGGSMKRDFISPPISPQYSPVMARAAGGKSPLDGHQQRVEGRSRYFRNKTEDLSSVIVRAERRDAGETESGGKNGVRKLSDYDCSEMKNLINQEAKFQSQVNDLSKQLSVSDSEASKLRFQIDELQRDVFTKTAGIDRLQSELNNAQSESEQVKHRLKGFEKDVQTFRTRNEVLEQELCLKTENIAKTELESVQKLDDLQSVIQTLNQRIQVLEKELEQLRRDKQQIEAKHARFLTVQDLEKQSIEESLQAALRDKLTINRKWEEQFEQLRTINILKEQQTLDDFEWKLRELERTCKKRLEDKDHSIHERLQDAYRNAEQKMRLAEEMMAEVANLRACEAEVGCLRTRTEDQDRHLAELEERQVQMKEAEYGLREETRKLRSLIELEKDNLHHMQRVHYNELQEKERWLQKTLDEKRCEIAVYWEDKLLHECGRLKSELEQMHTEEKAFAMDVVRKSKDEEFEQARSGWNDKIEECLRQIRELKAALVAKEEQYHKQLMEQQSSTDKDMMELRRIMDKIDTAHHDRFEKLLINHDREIEKLAEEKDAHLNEVETNYRGQIEHLQAELEAVKLNLETESQEKIESLIDKHRSELDEQWVNLIHQKSAAIKLLENEYGSKTKQLEEQCSTQQKSHESREVELLKTIDTLKNEVESNEAVIDDMQAQVDTLEGGVQVLNQEIAQQSEQLMRNRREADHKIRGLQEVLTKMQALQEQEKDDMQAKLLQAQKASQTTIDHLQRKCQCLSKLFEEVRGRYERRESRQEDLNIISDLRTVIAEQEKDLSCLNEEKRHFQMQLIKMQRTHQKQNEDDAESGDVTRNSSADSREDSERSSNNPEIVEIEDEEEEEDDESYEEVTEDEEGGNVEVIDCTSTSLSRKVVLMNGTVNFTIPPTIEECEDDCSE